MLAGPHFSAIVLVYIIIAVSWHDLNVGIVSRDTNLVSCLFEFMKLNFVCVDMHSFVFLCVCVCVSELLCMPVLMDATNCP